MDPIPIPLKKRGASFLGIEPKDETYERVADDEDPKGKGKKKVNIQEPDLESSPVPSVLPPSAPLPSKPSKPSEKPAETSDSEEEGEDFSARRKIYPIGTSSSSSNILKSGSNVALKKLTKTPSSISDSVTRRGQKSDVSTQTDEMNIIINLPSEQALEKLEGSELRSKFESAMPYHKGNKSVTLEKKELKRLKDHPTLKEFRALTTLKASDLIAPEVGKQGRKELKEKRKRMSFSERMKADLAQGWKKFSSFFEADMLFPFWRTPIRYVESNFGGTYASFFILARWIFMMNTLLALLATSCIIVFGIIGQDWSSMRQDYVPLVPAWSGTNDSFFFMGGYLRTVGNYEMDYAYFFVTISFFLASFLFVAQILRKVLLRRYNAVAGHYARLSPLTALVLVSWSYSLNSPDAIQAEKKLLSTSLKLILSTKREEHAQKPRKSEIILRRTIGYSLSLVALGGAAYLIYFIVTQEITVEVYGEKFLLTPYIVTAFNIVFPTLFYFLAKFEKYPNQTVEIQSEILRSYLVKMANIFVVLLGYVNADTNPTYSVENNCWETMIGHEFYQLLWINSLSDIGTIIVTSFSQTMAMRYFYGKQKTSGERFWEFDIPSNVLTLIYTQSLIWMGFLFCPMIPLVNVLLSFLVFYAKFMCLTFFAKHPSAVFRSLNITTLALVVLLVTLFISAIPIGYAMSVMKPACQIFSEYSTMSEVVTNAVEDASDSTQNFFKFLKTGGFLAPTFVFLILIIIVFASYVRVQKKRILELEEEVHLEREDKIYLIKNFQKKR